MLNIMSNCPNQKSKCDFCKTCFHTGSAKCEARTSGTSGGSGTSGTSGGTSHFPPSVTSLSGGMDLQLCDKILSLVCIAENSSTKWWNSYNYCENIKDGRGYTVSIVGFCSGTGDLIQVVQKLQEINPKHVLVKYIPALKKVDGTKKTTGLESFPSDLKALGNNDNDWNTAVWAIIQKLYWNPAMEYASKRGLVTPLTKYVLYDTILNFGDFDAFKKMSTKTPKDGGTESDWLTEFLKIKQATIQKDTSLGDTKNNRVDMQKALLSAGNVNLTSPMKVKCYGDSFTL